MRKIIELRIKNNKEIYQELAQNLFPHREKPAGSILFIVEGTKQKHTIGIRYPGKKVKKRDGERIRIKWANLYDFEVVPFKNGKEIDTAKFTFTELLKDFQENKRESEKFWTILEELYKNNTIIKRAPNLPGIPSKLYLLTLKWMWIQEDFNYKFSWDEVNSPIKYVLENRTGTRTAKGAGRAKFFAALILLKHHFTFEQVKKIIPLY